MVATSASLMPLSASIEGRPLPASIEGSSLEENEDITEGSTEIVTVMVGGVELEIETTPAEPSQTNFATFTKAQRLLVKPDKLNEVFERMAQGCRQKYEEPTFGLEDIEHLEDVYDLGTMLAKTKAHYQKYDMVSVFNVVLFKEPKLGNPVDLSKVIGSKNIFEDYAKLTIE